MLFRALIDETEAHQLAQRSVQLGSGNGNTLDCQRGNDLIEVSRSIQQANDRLKMFRDVHTVVVQRDNCAYSFSPQLRIAGCRWMCWKASGTSAISCRHVQPTDNVNAEQIGSELHPVFLLQRCAQFGGNLCGEEIEAQRGWPCQRQHPQSCLEERIPG